MMFKSGLNFLIYLFSDFFGRDNCNRSQGSDVLLGATTVLLRIDAIFTEFHQTG